MPTTPLTALRALAILALLAVGAGCSRDPGPAAAAGGMELLALPRPDLATAEAGVREQIVAKQAVLDRLLADPNADPTATAAAFADLGLVYIVYEFFDATEIAFENARRLAPEDFRFHYLRGYSARVAGKLEVAAAHFERALELAPDFLPALLRLGGVRLELGDPAAARALYERALALDPAVAATHEGLARVAAAQGDDAAAVSGFARALELDPQATALHYALAQSYRRMGELDKARFHLERRGLLGARIPDPVVNPIARLGESAQFYLMQGGEAMEAERYEVAAGAYREALDRAPKSLQAALGLAYSLEKLGDVAGARRELERALTAAGDALPREERREGAEMHRMLGALLVLAGRDGEAIGHFERCLDLAPDATPVRLRLGNALARQRRFEDAIAHYDRVLAAEPELAAEVLARRATALVNLGRGDEAVADFRRAVTAAPDDPRPRLQLAEALEFLGRPEEAAGERRQAAGLAPGAAGAGTLEARALVRQGRVDEAAARLAVAVEEAPERLDLRTELATLYGRIGRFDEALAQYAAILQAAPDHAAAHRGAITVLLLQGRYGQVRMQVQEALSHYPRDIQLARLQTRLLATAPDPRVRDGELALELAQRIHAAQPDAQARELLALAYAELGRYSEAAELVRALTAEAGEGEPARRLAAELRTFEAGRPWRAVGGEEILTASLGVPGRGGEG